MMYIYIFNTFSCVTVFNVSFLDGIYTWIFQRNPFWNLYNWIILFKIIIDMLRLTSDILLLIFCVFPFSHSPASLLLTSYGLFQYSIF